MQRAELCNPAKAAVTCTASCSVPTGMRREDLPNPLALHTAARRHCTAQGMCGTCCSRTQLCTHPGQSRKLVLTAACNAKVREAPAARGCGAAGRGCPSGREAQSPLASGSCAQGWGEMDQPAPSQVLHVLLRPVPHSADRLALCACMTGGERAGCFQTAKVQASTPTARHPCILRTTLSSLPQTQSPHG